MSTLKFKNMSGIILTLFSIAMFIPVPLSDEAQSYEFFPFGIGQFSLYCLGRFLSNQNKSDLMYIFECVVFLVIIIIYYEALNMV